MPVFKAFHVQGPSSLLQMERFSATAFLLDGFRSGEFGGTGETFDWELARRAGMRNRIIVAGGLTPENIDAAVKAAVPYGIDVSSGVEIRPGVKDQKKVRQFILRARNAAPTQDSGSNAKR